MQKFTLAGAAIACLASQSFAQSLNEMYISHTGTDDQEFAEIIGTPNASLDGIMFLMVEGDASSSLTGGLDLAVDLTGQTIPSDGYFVAGNTIVANLDLDIGSDNVLENGTETFYLISTTDVAAVNALVGTDVDLDGDFITDIANLSSVTILDIVAITDGGAGDETYDGAQVIGPDGTFLPAGMFRGNDAPNGWCTDTFLDFNLGADRTPGAANIACPTTDNQGTPYCFGDGSGALCPGAAVGAAGNGCPSLTNPNGGNLSDFGSAVQGGGYGLQVTGARTSTAGIVIQGANPIAYPNGNPSVPNSAGLICVNPQQRGKVVFTDGNGDITINEFQFGVSFDVTAQSPPNPTYYQFWHRDTNNPNANGPGPGNSKFNFTNALETFWQ